MSYEGYIVYFCENGHEIETVDAYDSREATKCPICNSTKFYQDFVNLTNGCYCSDISEAEAAQSIRCPAHPTVTKIIGYTQVSCGQCKGTGWVEITSHYKSLSCKDTTPTCKQCYGTGRKMVADVKTMIHCPSCQSTGKIAEAIYDISYLIAKYKKNKI